MIVELPGNLNELKGQIKRVEPGVWPVEIKKVTVKKAKASGEPTAIFIADLLDGPDAGEQVLFNTSLQLAALWKLRSLRDIVGVTDSDPTKFNTEEYIGRRLKVAISDKEFTGPNGQVEMRSNVDDFLAYE